MDIRLAVLPLLAAAVPVVAGVPTPTSPPRIVDGTYEVRVCPADCAGVDTSRGVLVVDRSRAAFETADETLGRARDAAHPGLRPNYCYVLEGSPILDRIASLRVDFGEIHRDPDRREVISYFSTGESSLSSRVLSAGPTAFSADWAVARGAGEVAVLDGSVQGRGLGPPDASACWTAFRRHRAADLGVAADESSRPPERAVVPTLSSQATLRELFGGGPGETQSVDIRVMPDAVIDPDAGPDAWRDDFVPGDAMPVHASDDHGGPHDGHRLLLAGDVLVAGRTGASYRLLDALFVRTDPGGFPAVARELSPAIRRAVLIVNSHFNSQEGFAAHTLVALVGDRLEPLWHGPLLYSVQYADDRCDLHRVVQSLERFDSVAVAGSGWPDVDVVYRDVESCERDGVVADSSSRDFAVTLQWNETARRYDGSLPELEALNAERRGVDE